MTDDEIAQQILGAIPEPVPAPKWKWFWMYTKPPRERVDDLHLMVVGLVAPTLVGTPTFPVPEGSWPWCWRLRDVVLPRDMDHWWVFNVGGANVIRLLTHAAGNNANICKDCMAHATTNPKEIAPP